MLLRSRTPLNITRSSIRSFSTQSRLSCPSTSPPPSDRPPKLRFAPSPTGFLHLGGLRTALYNHLLARKLGGEWVLRVEDTDHTRYVEGAVKSLLRTLKWAGLEYDQGPGKEQAGQGPYFQSQRAEIYNRYLEPLLAEGKAYHCFCSPERLAQTRKMLQTQGKKHTSGYDRKCLGLTKEEVEEKLGKGEQSIVRFKSSSEKLVQEDLIYDSITYESLPIEDFVLRKSDGLPTYHFANVVDDYSMGITHVLRGEEWLPSTPKHLQLYRALSLPAPKFAHLPLLVNPDGSKLSKRTGDVSVENYIEKGFEPEALLNFVALLGWSPQHSVTSHSTTLTTTANETTETGKEDNSQASDLLSIRELIEKFSLGGINKNRPTLQQGKLEWLNRNHVKMKLFSEEEGAEERRNDLAKRVKEVVLRELGKEDEVREEVLREEYLLAVVDALKDRLHTINDIPALGRYFFLPPSYDTPVSQKLYKSMNPQTYRDTLSAALPILSSLPSHLFSRSLSPTETPSIEQDLLVSLSSISIATPSPSQAGEAVDSRKKASQVMSPLRHCLTGQKVGASVAGTVRVLGREETRRRLEGALEWSRRQGE
ncbi:glutamate--tRNA ligase MSE1 [Sporobolomyces salmoneus]|uniref:glutamate--tRNA ligase MSE1 n=1 Tax=Sporobolomyces salmoneus TaxID=183962 RepID=UPI00317D128E